jgi:hypothetical protein
VLSSVNVSQKNIFLSTLTSFTTLNPAAFPHFEEVIRTPLRKKKNGRKQVLKKIMHVQMKLDTRLAISLS